MKTMPDDVLFLKEKIATSGDFTPQERDLILDCLNLGSYAGQHTYPSNHGPGSSKWTTAAWALLDQLPPSAMTTTTRWMLGGMIAGALSEMFKEGKRSKRWP